MNDYYRLIRNMLHQGKIREASYRDINKIMLVYDRFEGNYEVKMKFIVKYGYFSYNHWKDIDGEWYSDAFVLGDYK